MAIASVTLLSPIICSFLGTPAAAANWSAVLSTIGTFLTTNTIVLPGTMSAAGAAVSGKGIFSCLGSADTLGVNLALAAGSPPTDKAAIAKWTIVAKNLILDINTNATVNPAAFVAVPAGGAVTGTGLMAFTAPLLGALLAAAGISTDPLGMAGWLFIGTNIETQLALLASVLPTPIGMTSPSGGGPLVGAGTIV